MVGFVSSLEEYFLFAWYECLRCRILMKTFYRTLNLQTVRIYCLWWHSAICSHFCDWKSWKKKTEKKTVYNANRMWRDLCHTYFNFVLFTPGFVTMQFPWWYQLRKSSHCTFKVRLVCYLLCRCSELQWIVSNEISHSGLSFLARMPSSLRSFHPRYPWMKNVTDIVSMPR